MLYRRRLFDAVNFPFPFNEQSISTHAHSRRLVTILVYETHVEHAKVKCQTVAECSSGLGETYGACSAIDRFSAKSLPGSKCINFCSAFATFHCDVWQQRRAVHFHRNNLHDFAGMAERPACSLSIRNVMQNDGNKSNRSQNTTLSVSAYMLSRQNQ